MKYRLLNNHYVVEIDGYNFVIDTGSPRSYSFRNDLREVQILNNNLKLNPAGYNFDIKKIHKLVGFPVDGLLGKDAFGETGLTFYKENEAGGQVEFASHNIEGASFPIVELLNGYGILMQIDNNKLYLVDTGARYGYGASHMFNGLTNFDNVWDYNPMLGDLYSPIYHVDVEINHKKCHASACYNRSVTFPVPNFLMIGNITDFFERECCIDYKNRKVIFN